MKFIMDYIKELNDYLLSISYPVLIRNMTALRCNCIDPVTKDAKADCVHCGGTGQRFQLVEVPGVRQLGSSLESYPLSLIQDDLGKIAVPATRWYFPRDTKLRPGDEVWEVEWRSGIPVEVKMVHRLSHVDHVIYQGNEVAYVRAYGRTMPVVLPVARFLVKTNAGIKVYEPRFGGRKLS